jgi:LacI family transcriptional regulator
MAKITLDRIAEEIGVSKVAVSKALNDQKGVSESLRKRIKDYADSIGYAKRSSSIDMRNKRFLFLINQDFFLTPSEQYYSTIFYFLSSACNKANCQLQIAFLEPENTLEKMKTSIASFKPDGIYIAGEVGKLILRFVEKLTIPTVFIDYFSPLYNCNYVYVDNYHLSFLVTKHLIYRGHRRIGFVGDITNTSSIADRYYGFLRAMQDERLAFDSRWHINENLEKKTDPLIFSDRTEELPTAFICHCDAAAQRLYTALAIRGLKVPDNMSVISFDNTDLCDSLMPKLTSAGPLKEYYARKAFQTMSDCLNVKNKTLQVLVKATLTERASVRNLLEH